MNTTGRTFRTLLCVLATVVAGCGGDAGVTQEASAQLVPFKPGPFSRNGSPRFCRDSLQDAPSGYLACLGSLPNVSLSDPTTARRLWMFATTPTHFAIAVKNERCALLGARCEQVKDPNRKVVMMFAPVRDAVKIVPDFLEEPVVVARLALERTPTTPKSEMSPEGMYNVIDPQRWVTNSGTDQLTEEREHLLIVSPSYDPSYASWQIVRITKSVSASPPTYKLDIARSGGRFRRCPRIAHIDDSDVHGQFLECDALYQLMKSKGFDHTAVTEADYRKARSAQALPFFQPAWLTCGLGCCEVRL